MASQSKFEQFLANLDFPFRARKRTRAEDLKDLLTEVMEELELADHRGRPKLLGVTFDRTKNTHFDYWLFDELLVQIDAGEGGGGIRKPLHQMRVITWRKSPKELVRVLRRVAGHYPNLKFQRLLVFPLFNEAGYRVLTTRYRR